MGAPLVSKLIKREGILRIEIQIIDLARMIIAKIPI